MRWGPRELAGCSWMEQSQANNQAGSFVREKSEARETKGKHTEVGLKGNTGEQKDSLKEEADTK